MKKSSSILPVRWRRERKIRLCLVLRLFKVLCARLDVDGDAKMYSLITKENREWDHDEVVLVLAEDAADFFHDSYDHEFIVADTNGPPDGVHAEK